MKKKFIVLLVLAFVLAIVISIPVIAAGLTQTITVFTDMSIKVDGEVFQPKDANGNDVLIMEYEGTTYAPLRALAEAYGLEVGYDDATRMATVDKSDDGPVIYITRTGSKYHYDEHCNGGTYWEVPIETAIGFGLKPCEKCVN